MSPNIVLTLIPIPVHDTKSSAGVVLKAVDVATLGNLCVDIVLNVPNLPPAKKEDRKAYMDRLAASPPDKVWILAEIVYSFSHLICKL